MAYYETENGFIYNDDALDTLKQMTSKSVQSIITSPPYWALRDYGCDNQIGQEKTFQEYLNKLVMIFEECKRVLKDDGLLFINIGDTYAGTGSKGKYVDPKNKNGRNGQSVSKNQKVVGIKRKSLIGIPQRLQIALIDNGWTCRNNIIWHKPNAMPSSVKDRFTVDFENIFMFSKSSKYKFNQILESVITQDKKIRNKRTVWAVNTKPYKESHFATFPEELIEILVLCSTDKEDVVMDIFMGSGTTAKVSEQHGRKWVGIELNKEYCEIIKNRLSVIKQKLF